MSLNILTQGDTSVDSACTMGMGFWALACFDIHTSDRAVRHYWAAYEERVIALAVAWKKKCQKTHSRHIFSIRSSLNQRVRLSGWLLVVSTAPIDTISKIVLHGSFIFCFLHIIEYFRASHTAIVCSSQVCKIFAVADYSNCFNNDSLSVWKCCRDKQRIIISSRFEAAGMFWQYIQFRHVTSFLRICDDGMQTKAFIQRTTAR